MWEPPLEIVDYRKFLSQENGWQKLLIQKIVCNHLAELKKTQKDHLLKAKQAHVFHNEMVAWCKGE